MTIQHELAQNRFSALDESGERLGVIEYTGGDAGEIFATHTHVFTGHEGKGIAGQLLDALVRYAEQNSLKIIPTCSYVVAAFQKNPTKYAAVIK